MRQWHKAVARSMHWSESEEILDDDDIDPHLTHSIPRYRKARPQVSRLFPTMGTTAIFVAILSGGVAIGFAISRAINR